MRKLDLQHSEGAERTCCQTDTPVKSPGCRQINQQDDKQVCDGRELASYNHDLGIASLPDPFSCIADEKDRQGAIDEEGVAHIVGIEGGIGRIPILTKAAHTGQSGLDIDQEALIRVQVLFSRPIDPAEAQDCARGQQQDQHQVKDPVFFDEFLRLLLFN